MDLIQNLLKLRHIADPILIGRNNIPFDVLAALLGLITGLAVAYVIWYRSAHLIRNLEAERSRLKKGDIDIQGDREIAGAASRVSSSGSGIQEGPRTAEAIPASVAASVPPKREVVKPDSTDTVLSVPEDADDLTVLEGITRDRAAELNRAGIFKYSQLADLDEDARRKFAFRFGWSDINWGAWAAAAAAAAGGAGLLRRDGKETVAMGPVASSGVVPSAPGPSVSAPGSVAVPRPAAVVARPGAVVPIAAATVQDSPSWDGASDWSRNWVNRGLIIPAAGAGAMATYYQASAQPEPWEGASDWSQNWVSRGLMIPAAGAGAMATFYQAADQPKSWEGASDWSQNWVSRGLMIPAAGAAAMADHYLATGHQQPALPGAIEISEWGREWPRRGLDSLAAASSTMSDYYSAHGKTLNVNPPPADVLPAESPAGDDLLLDTVYDAAPADADDLTLLEGIDSQKAAELNRAGIYKFSQLEALSDEQRARLGRRFKWPEINWGKWGSLGLIGATAARGVAELLGKDGEGKESAAAGGSSSISPALPEVQPDWTWVTGQEQGTDLERVQGIHAEDLERLRAEGITTMEQLANLPEAKRAEIRSNFEWGDIDWGKWGSVGALGAAGVAAMSSLGKDRTESAPDQIATAQVEAESELARRDDTEADATWGWRFRRKPADADDLTAAGISAEDAAELNRQGVYTFRQMEALPAEQRESVKKRFGWGDLDWGKWAAMGTVAAAAIGLGKNRGTASERDDDTVSINPSAAARSSFRAVDNVPGVASVSNRGTASERDDDTISIDPSAAARSSFRAVDNVPGVAPVSNREAVDEREGDTVSIDPTMAARTSLRAVDNDPKGSQKSGQHWTWGYRLVDDVSPVVSQEVEPAEAETPSSSAQDDVRGKTGWGDIEWSKWSTIESAGAPVGAMIGAMAVSRENVGTPAEVVWETESKKLSDALKAKQQPAPAVSVPTVSRLGNVYSSQPDVVDDLTEINGIGLATESKLNQLGIYTFGQIAQWDENAIQAVEEILGSPGCVGRDQWIAQARDFIGVEAPAVELEPDRPPRTAYADVLRLFKGENVDVDDNFGVVYKAAPPLRDDLKQIKGLGKQIESELAARGVFRLCQIANWNDYNVWAFGQALGFPGKITREEWVPQARALLATVKPPSQVAAPSNETLAGVAGSKAADITVPAAVSVFSDPELDGGPRGIFGTGEAGSGDQQQRVAYIMDVSRSLTPAQLRLSKMELASAVSSLPENALYQVIFFSGPSWFAHQRMVEGGARGEDVMIQDGDTQYKWVSGFGGFEFEYGNDNLPTTGWLRATRENIESTLKDIEDVGKSYGTTWHLPLTMALNLEPAPKTIYFLTDGETARQEQVAEDMVALAHQRGENTRINTIALMVPGASVPLHRIAKGTAGNYCLVIAGGKVLKDAELLEYLAEKDISLDL